MKELWQVIPFSIENGKITKIGKPYLTRKPNNGITCKLKLVNGLVVVVEKYVRI